MRSDECGHQLLFLKHHLSARLSGGITVCIAIYYKWILNIKPTSYSFSSLCTESISGSKCSQNKKHLNLKANRGKSRKSILSFAYKINFHSSDWLKTTQHICCTSHESTIEWATAQHLYMTYCLSSVVQSSKHSSTLNFEQMLSVRISLISKIKPWLTPLLNQLSNFKIKP